MSRTTLIALAIVIVVVGAVTAFFGRQLGLPGFASRSAAIVVCQGENRPGCMGKTEHFVTCETNMAEWMKAVRPSCGAVTVKKLSDISSAGKCGYAAYELTCASR